AKRNEKDARYGYRHDSAAGDALLARGRRRLRSGPGIGARSARERPRERGDHAGEDEGAHAERDPPQRRDVRRLRARRHEGVVHQRFFSSGGWGLRSLSGSAPARPSLRLGATSVETSPLSERT